LAFPTPSNDQSALLAQTKAFDLSRRGLGLECGHHGSLSGIGVNETGGAHYGFSQGQIVEQKGPDGSVKRVQIVAPTLY
jgi:hypothetical protein